MVGDPATDDRSEQRIQYALERMLEHLPDDARRQFESLLTPEALTWLIGILAVGSSRTRWALALRRRLIWKCIPGRRSVPGRSWRTSWATRSFPRPAVAASAWDDESRASCWAATTAPNLTRGERAHGRVTRSAARMKPASASSSMYSSRRCCVATPPTPEERARFQNARPRSIGRAEALLRDLFNSHLNPIRPTAGIIEPVYDQIFIMDQVHREILTHFTIASVARGSGDAMPEGVWRDDDGIERVEDRWSFSSFVRARVRIALPGCALGTDQPTDLPVLLMGELSNLQDHAAPPPRRLHELCPDLRNDALRAGGRRAGAGPTVFVSLPTSSR